MTQPTITDEALDAAEAAGQAGYEIWRKDRDRDARPIRTIAVQAARAGAEAAAPHIAAQALRNYADSAHPHPVGHARRTDYGTGIEHDTECAGCGSSWSETEGGCTERVEILRAANALLATGPDCNCHETGAPCSCGD